MPKNGKFPALKDKDYFVALRDSCNSVKEMADKVGCATANIRYYAEYVHNVELPQVRGKYNTESNDETPPMPSIPKLVREQRDKAELKATTKELKQLVGKKAQIDAIHDAIESASLRVDVPPLLPFAEEQGEFDEEYPVLVLSDWHVGMNTDPRVSSGYAVTVETATKQMNILIKSLYRCWDIQRRSMKWKKLLILDLGDSVEGQHMRASQHREADPVSVAAVQTGLLIANLIRAALQIFQEVEYRSVPGNHGRVSQKTGTAGLDEVDPINSWDWISTEYARGALGQFNGSDVDLPARLKIYNHGTYIAKTEVAGWPIVFEHGSQIKGGSYGGVPYYPVARAASNVKNLLASEENLDDDTSRFLKKVGEPYLFCIGHFHRATMIPTNYGWVCMGGSFPPTTPYISSTKHQALRPTQWLLSLHPKKGLTMQRPLYLDLPEWQGLTDDKPQMPKLDWENTL